MRHGNDLDERPGRWRRAIRHAAKRLAFAVFRIGTRFGVHILPVHYYTPVPNILELDRSRDLWLRRSEMPGIHVDLDAQAATLRSICEPYRDEYVGAPHWKQAMREGFGAGYGLVESQVLYAVVRSLKPRRIVEIGGGVSTFCMRAASQANTAEGESASEITVIEPNPSKALSSCSGINLLRKPVQAIPLSELQRLSDNDLLFVDSSHTVKVGSDVNHIILEILPRLQKGVVVHFHDIFFPYDYQRNVLTTFMHWSETSLLRAFLIENHRLAILFSLSMLHYDRRSALQEVVPGYRPESEEEGLRRAAGAKNQRPKDGFFLVTDTTQHFPSSIFLRVVA